MFALRTLVRLKLEEIGRAVGTTGAAVSRASMNIRIRARRDSALTERLDCLATHIRSGHPGLTWKSMAWRERESR